MRLAPAAAAVPPHGAVGAFLRLARIKFLFQSMLVTSFGVALAVHTTGAVSLGWYALTLAFAWTTHLMTHFCNDYFDLEADRANRSPTAWTGGSRVLVEGLLRPSVSLSAAFVALFTGLALIAVMPDPADRTLALALTTLAWFYTAPPLRLNYHALGEVTCATVLYGMGPLLAARLQGGGQPPLLWWCIALVCALQALRCLIMNLADIDGDRRAGKTTLATVLGPRRLRHCYAVGQGAVYASVAALAWAGALPPAVAVAQSVAAPVGGYVIRSLFTDAMRDPRKANLVTFWASVQLPLTTCATMLALLADMALAGRPIPPAWCAVAAAATAAFAWWLARTVLTRKH
ncbi:prenyltransferase [Streptomyces niger]|uniref:prenyltransferase n=1 Tax=Streptomyces niger TaxID=66373 RepID=UPI000699DF10|nr:prenyltransferase [Streptomyces niger]